MADPQTAEIIKAVVVAGGAILGGTLTAFAKNFFTADGKDAREFRQEYRDEIKRLREERVEFQDEIQNLRDDVDTLRAALSDQQAEHAKQMQDLRKQIGRLTIQNQHYLIGRTEARALLNALERRDNLQETPWQPDPPEGAV